MIFATRQGGAERELAGHPEVKLQGLDDHHARRLVTTVIPGRFNESVRDDLFQARGEASL
jgi:hypothetical protein